MLSIIVLMYHAPVLDPRRDFELRRGFQSLPHLVYYPASRSLDSGQPGPGYFYIKLPVGRRIEAIC